MSKKSDKVNGVKNMEEDEDEESPTPSTSRVVVVDTISKERAEDSDSEGDSSSDLSEGELSSKSTKEYQYNPSGMGKEDWKKLKSWLIAILDSLCDAEPESLATYVLALIKKDKPEVELRKSMSDLLQVFLQDETKVFIDCLFELLTTGDYLTKSPHPIKLRKDPVQGGEAYCDISSQGSESPYRLQFSGQSAIGGNLADLLSTTATGSRESTKRDQNDVKDERERNRRSRSSARKGAGRAGRSPRADRVGDRRYHPRKIRHERDLWSRRRSRSQSRNRSASAARNRSRTPPPSRYRRHNSRSRSRTRSRSGSQRRFRSPACNSHRDMGDKQGGNRCRDFDEKGVCMRGELCCFDHGSDPLTLKDVGNVGIPGVPSAVGKVDFDRTLQTPGYGAVSTSVMGPSVSTIGEYYPDNPAMGPSRWGHPIYRPQGISYSPIFRSGFGGMMPQGPPIGSFAPQRALVSVPMMGIQHSSQGGNPHGQYLPIIGMNHHSARGMHIGRSPGRGGFDHSRLGFKDYRNYNNCSLEVKNVPRAHNNILDLNSHFQKFGTIINILINFENDPEAALVTFSSPFESQAAFRSTEAVFSNRFIRLFWHNKEKENEESMDKDSSQGLSVRNRFGRHVHDDKQDQENNPVSSNNLTKNVYNPTLLVANKTDAAAEKAEAVEAIRKGQERLAVEENFKKNQEEQKNETLKLQNDLRKRRQEMMSEQIEQQKKLISKLEFGKGTMKSKEREQLMNLVKVLQNHIEMLKKDLDENNAKALAAQPVPKSKQETEREILDAELELYNKEQDDGVTVTLQNNISNLQDYSIEMYRYRGGFRGNPRRFGCRSRGGRYQQRALRTVDHRPTSIRVSEFPLGRLAEILPHFSQYGIITEYETDQDTPSMILNFESRRHAEAAFAGGKLFGETTLMIKWVPNGVHGGAPQNTPDFDTSHVQVGNGTSVDIEDNELEAKLAEEILLAYDEDDEIEIEKDRSWRR